MIHLGAARYVFSYEFLWRLLEFVVAIASRIVVAAQNGIVHQFAVAVGRDGVAHGSSSGGGSASNSVRCGSNSTTRTGGGGGGGSGGSVLFSLLLV